MTTVGQAYKRGKLDPEWRIQQWWEATSYIPHGSPDLKSPRFHDHRSEYFLSEEVATDYSDKQRVAYPTRCYHVGKEFVLSNDGGKTGYLLSGKLKPLVIARFTPI